MALTAERLRQVLNYEPETGAFTWLVRTSNRAKVGAVAGAVGKRHGYRLIGVDGTLYRANRLAWLYMTGGWPPEHVDHANGRRDDDRWENLRAAGHSQNLANAKRPRHNTSGLKGVHFHKQSGLWRARICKDRKHNSLGLFQTKEAAHAAYCVAAQKLYGEFARSQ